MLNSKFSTSTRDTEVNITAMTGPPCTTSAVECKMEGPESLHSAFSLQPSALPLLAPLIGPATAHAPLLDAVFAAHQRAAQDNENVSRVAAFIAGDASGSFEQAVIAAIATLGAKHGPVTAARRAIFQTPAPQMDAAIQSGQKIPGWGNSFFKACPDPAWRYVSVLVRAHYAGEQAALDYITERLFKAGKYVLPNAAAYTAICAHLLNLPWGTESVLFLLPRIPVWAARFAQ